MKITIEEPIDQCIEELPADDTTSIIIQIVSRAGSIPSPEQGTYISFQTCSWISWAETIAVTRNTILRAGKIPPAVLAQAEEVRS